MRLIFGMAMNILPLISQNQMRSLDVAELRDLIRANNAKGVVDRFCRSAMLSCPKSADVFMEAASLYYADLSCKLPIDEYVRHFEIAATLLEMSMFSKNIAKCEALLDRMDQIVGESTDLGQSDNLQVMQVTLYAKVAELLLSKAKTSVSADQNAILACAAVCCLHAIATAKNVHTSLDSHTGLYSDCTFGGFEADVLLSKLKAVKNSSFWNEARNLSENPNWGKAVFGHLHSRNISKDAAKGSFVYNNKTTTFLSFDCIGTFTNKGPAVFEGILSTQPSYLQRVLWVLLQARNLKPESVLCSANVDYLFPNLQQMCYASFERCTTESLCRLDIQAFLHFCIIAYLRRLAGSSKGVPDLMYDVPVTAWQLEWWNSVYCLTHNCGRPEQRIVLQKGLEILRMRATKNLDPFFVSAVASAMQEESQNILDRGDQELSTNIANYVSYYWRYISLLANKPNAGSTSTLFNYNDYPKTKEQREELISKSKFYLGTNLMENGQLQEAAACFEGTSVPQSKEKLAKVCKVLGGISTGTPARSFTNAGTGFSLEGSLGADDFLGGARDFVDYSNDMEQSRLASYNGATGGRLQNLDGLNSLNTSIATHVSDEHDARRTSNDLSYSLSIVKTFSQSHDLLIRTVLDQNKALSTTLDSVTDNVRELLHCNNGLALEVKELRGECRSLRDLITVINSTSTTAPSHGPEINELRETTKTALLDIKQLQSSIEPFKQQIESNQQTVMSEFASLKNGVASVVQLVETHASKTALDLQLMKTSFEKLDQKVTNLQQPPVTCSKPSALEALLTNSVVTSSAQPLPQLIPVQTSLSVQPTPFSAAQGLKTTVPAAPAPIFSPQQLLTSVLSTTFVTPPTATLASSTAPTKALSFGDLSFSRTPTAENLARPSGAGIASKASTFQGFSFKLPGTHSLAAPTEQQQQKPFGAVFGKTETANVIPVIAQPPSVKSEPVLSTSIFGKGSTVSQLSFQAVSSAAISNGFTKTESFKGFKEQPLFSDITSVADEDDNDGEGPEEFEPHIDFAPVVPLPDLVELTTGEENEEVCFCERVKLFRFNVELNEFKERGVGDLKILKNKETLKYRIVMRREQVHKLCANHCITAGMKLIPMAKSEKAFTWMCQDYSEGELVKETLAARFKSEEHAARFKSVFENVVARTSTPQDAPALSSAVITTKPSFGEQFKPKPGSWECKGCFVRNDAECTKCPCCGTFKDATPSASGKSLVPTLFGSSLTMQNTSSPVYFGFGIPKSASEMPTPATTVSRLQTPQNPVTSISGTCTAKGSGATANKSIFGVSAAPSTAHSESGFMFGQNSNFAGLSFQALAQQSPAATTSAFSNSPDFKGFGGEGTQLFSHSVPKASSAPHDTGGHDEEDGEQPEDFEPQIDFAPVIPLPDIVELKTGEEDEEVCFSERAKLFRFHAELNEFKERGLGILKILKNKTSNKYRIVMRREQVLKLCANHMISADMKLVPMSKCDKAFTWLCQDFSEGELVKETLAARFKSADVASKFKQVFEMAVNSCSATSGTDVPVTTTQLQPGFGDKFKPKAGSWECKSCYVRNDSEAESCTCCGSNKDGTTQPKTMLSSSLFGASAAPSSFSSASTSLFGASAGLGGTASNNKAFSGFTFGLSSLSATQQKDSPPKPVFGFGSISGFKQPEALAASTEEKKDGVNETSAPDDDNSYYEDEENENAQFEPVMTLPLQEVKTGEEDEEILFSQRAKLYRYVNKEWKERGVGDFKLLQHNTTRKVRALMRREQVLKVCLNHNLSSDSKLKEKDDKTWIWSAMDFAEGSASTPETFALRFKTPEQAAEFRDAFESAVISTNVGVSPMRRTEISKIPSAETPKQEPATASTSLQSFSFKITPEQPRPRTPNSSSSDSDIAIVYEATATAEQMEKARKFLLPDTFYLYENKAPCPGCRGCEPGDATSGRVDSCSTTDTGSSEELVEIFEKRATLQVLKNGQWTPLGSGTVRICYDRGVDGHHVFFSNDAEVELLNHVIVMECSCSCTYSKVCPYVEWTAWDFAATPEKKSFRLIFSSNSSVAEFEQCFQKGIELAKINSLNEYRPEDNLYPRERMPPEFACLKNRLAAFSVGDVNEKEDEE